MALIGNTYVQASDPGSVGCGYDWINSSNGNKYARNTSNTAWVLIGNVNQENLGLAPKSGFAATGGITGVSGWAPVDSPDFTTGASIEGISIATVNDLSSVSDGLYSSIQSLVAQAMSAYVTNDEVRSAVCFGSGKLDFTSAPTTAQEIPLPVFESDGQMATQSQCKWLVSLGLPYIATGYAGSGFDQTWSFRNEADSADVDPTSVRKFCAYNTTLQDGMKRGSIVYYMIMGIR